MRILLGMMALLVLGSASWSVSSDGTTTPSHIDFNRDIRPLLSENCFSCHGPDTKALQGGLRLDRRDAALGAAESGKQAVVPGHAEKSELWLRVSSTNEELRMPPEETKKQLTVAQLDLLKRWLNEGAQWTDHWSFQPVAYPATPRVQDPNRSHAGPIDAFILSRLEREGLKPTPPESRERLIRRVTLDLTGLPPTLAEVDAFLNDHTDQAFERVVDRLLDSKHFGERLALIWLDLARYGDTSGYHNDSLRDMWLWREWVINAFNSNMPFDRFTIEQIAGDLLPNASVDQQIASGFHRNHMTSDEGGLIDAEYRNLYVVDRVNTTGVTWLGMTVGCAQCHDHKYDPLTMRDFYSMYAFFNNVPENGKDGVRDRNPKPFLRVTTSEQAAQLKLYESELAQLEVQLKQQESAYQNTREYWEAEVARLGKDFEPVGPMETYALDGSGDGLASSGEIIPAIPLGKIEYVDGVAGQGLAVGSASGFSYKNRAEFERDQPFSIGLFVSPQLEDRPKEKHGKTAAVANIDENSNRLLARQDTDGSNRGWSISFEDSLPSFRLVHRWPEDCIHVTAAEKIPDSQFSHITFTYDGSAKASGVKLYVDGRPVRVQVRQDQLSGSIKSSGSFTIGITGKGDTQYRSHLDQVKVYTRVLDALEVSFLGAKQVLRIATTPANERTKAETDQLNTFYLQVAAPELDAQRKTVEQKRKSKDDYEKSLPNTMVMAEMDTPRQTFIKVRGNYDQDGQQVGPGVPDFLPPLRMASSGKQPNRLDFARWLVSPEQPLTARVMVNRLWAMLFGTGLVKTLNDFGSQGERPTHAELLDWLAADFMTDWNVKRTLKQMALTSTYRQSSAIPADLLSKDRENRLLARGPRQRLDAEAIRDNALAIAGVLNPSIGGRSIKPYQPEGTWEINEMSGYKYVTSTGADLYRRGLYVYWRRSTVYPSFVTLDAPTREFCIAQRAKTSTPLQSLVLMNDPVFVEAARAFAQRVLLENRGRDVDVRLTHAWRLALARWPTEIEFSILKSVLDKQLATFNRDPQAAKKLIDVGELKPPSELEPTELAAWTAVANVILNLNETITN